LMEGPKPQTALDGHVPVSVLEQLRTAGMNKRMMLRQGSMATRLVVHGRRGSADILSPAAPHLPRCDDPGLRSDLR
jgi:hypothetical protein